MKTYEYIYEKISSKQQIIQYFKTIFALNKAPILHCLESAVVHCGLLMSVNPVSFMHIHSVYTSHGSV